RTAVMKHAVLNKISTKQAATRVAVMEYVNGYDKSELQVVLNKISTNQAATRVAIKDQLVKKSVERNELSARN
ncbi:MAG: hypothetical protein KAR80_07140, partial [Rhodospirillaceae bacterium]|nr:hypothetical protein [Rhodospirillaceae bacterium]